MEGDYVKHDTRFAKTADGLYLAYQVVGSGPVDVVMDFHAFAGNVDLIWDEPDWGPLLVGMSEFARLIVHDRRGSGALQGGMIEVRHDLSGEASEALTAPDATA